MMPPGSEFCTDCGAPLKDSAEGSDAEVYPELARANLLRMRGEYKQAEEICLSILKRYPNNATANTLLGDICAERGDLEQAAEWYELALDILPDSQADREKLQQVKQRMADREAASAVEQLGLPEKRPPFALIGTVAALFVVFAVGVAFVVGQRSAAANAAFAGTVEAPVVLDQTTPAPDPIQNQPPPPIENNRPAPEPAVARPREDRAIARAIAGDSPEGARLVDAQYLPQNNSLTLTYISPQGVDERLLGAQLAMAALQRSTVDEVNLQTVSRVHLRAVRDERIFYTATVTREAVVATVSDEWKQIHGDNPMARANAILSEERYANGMNTTAGATPGL
jgi:hypothetical protein